MSYDNFDQYYADYLALGLSDNDAAEAAYKLCEMEL